MLRTVLRCPAESALRLLGEVLKGARILHREIRKNLAIEFDSGFLQSADEARVAQSMLFCGRADAHDPQRPELPFALLASRISELQAAFDRFFGGTVQLRFGKEITAGTV